MNLAIDGVLDHHCFVSCCNPKDTLSILNSIKDLVVVHKMTLLSEKLQKLQGGLLKILDDKLQSKYLNSHLKKYDIDTIYYFQLRSAMYNAMSKLKIATDVEKLTIFLYELLNETEQVTPTPTTWINFLSALGHYNRLDADRLDAEKKLNIKNFIINNVSFLKIVIDDLYVHLNQNPNLKHLNKLKNAEKNLSSSMYKYCEFTPKIAQQYEVNVDTQCDYNMREFIPDSEKKEEDIFITKNTNVQNENYSTLYDFEYVESILNEVYFVYFNWSEYFQKALIEIREEMSIKKFPPFIFYEKGKLNGLGFIINKENSDECGDVEYVANDNPIYYHTMSHHDHIFAENCYIYA